VIDAKRMTGTLLELLAIPSPCGFTDEVVHFLSERLTELGVEFELTRRGTIRARLPGTETGPARALVTHVDTVGAMVRLVRDDGRVMVAPIGHWSSRFAEGARVTVFSEKRAHRGCLIPCVEWGVSRDHGVEAVPTDWDHLELRIEDAVFSGADVAKLGIEVGDFIALDPNPEVLDSGYVVARNLDNKAGTAAVLELIRHLTETDEKPTHDTYVIFTITETIGAGMGGAVLPEVSELVTVDFASVRSSEKSPFKRVTLASGDASGPYDFHLTAHLRKIAERADIPIQQKHLKAFHSDAAAALVAGNDVRTAVLAYAGDASHSVERTHIDSLMNIARLLEVYVTSEPTFSEDDAVIPVEHLSHQFRSDQLPQVTEAPNTASVISNRKEGKDGGRNG